MSDESKRPFPMKWINGPCQVLSEEQKHALWPSLKSERNDDETLTSLPQNSNGLNDPWLTNGPCMIFYDKDGKKLECDVERY